VEEDGEGRRSLGVVVVPEVCEVEAWRATEEDSGRVRAEKGLPSPSA